MFRVELQCYDGWVLAAIPAKLEDDLDENGNVITKGGITLARELGEKTDCRTRIVNERGAQVWPVQQVQAGKRKKAG